MKKYYYIKYMPILDKGRLFNTCLFISPIIIIIIYDLVSQAISSHPRRRNDTISFYFMLSLFSVFISGFGLLAGSIYDSLKRKSKFRHKFMGVTAFCSLVVGTSIWYYQYCVRLEQKAKIDYCIQNNQEIEGIKECLKGDEFVSYE